MEINMKLDKKFTGGIKKVKDGTMVPGDEWLVFLAKDTAFALTLPTYLDNCIKLGCDDKQIQMVRNMIENVAKWRLDNPNRCKIPDAIGEKTLEN